MYRHSAQEDPARAFYVTHRICYHISSFSFFSLLLGRLPLLHLLFQPRVLLIRHNFLALFVVQVFSFKPRHIFKFSYRNRVFNINRNIYFLLMRLNVRCLNSTDFYKTHTGGNKRNFYLQKILRDKKNK